MKSKLFTLFSGILVLLVVVQCKNSVTQENQEFKLNKPELIFPEANSTQSTSLTFFWEDVESVENFRIQLSLEKDFASMVVDSIINSAGVDIGGLHQDTTFHWRIRSIGQDGKSPWSDRWKFKTHTKSKALLAPSLEAPKNKAGEVGRRPDFSWNSVEGAGSYELHVSRGEQMVINREVAAGGFRPSEPLAAEARYFWRLRAIGPDTTGPWSGVHSFTTVGKATPPVELVTPADEADNQPTAVSLTWNPLSGIDRYRVQLAEDQSFATLVTDKMVEGGSYEVSSLANNRYYYWRVQVAGDEDPGNWSSPRRFRTHNKETTGQTSSERQALMDLYEATGGKHWHNNRGWGQGAPSNDWYGVQVDSEGRVVRLDLYDNGLQGQLPESIGSFKRVRYLNVKKNNLSGNIPLSIGDMASLQSLILSGRTYEVGGTLKEPPRDLLHAYHPGKKRSATNAFSGTIPGTIGKLSDLLFLEISDQPDIRGPIPVEIGNLSKLKGLYLNLNNFAGYTLPASLGNLLNLKHLYIANAQLEGTIPASFKQLKGLMYLNLGSTKNKLPNNNLTGDLPDFSDFTELRSISLSSNNLNGEYPAFWNNGNFTELHTIRIAWNNLSGRLHGFDNLPALESLGLEGNNLSGTITEQVLELPDRLQILGLGWNNFTGKLPEGGWPDFWQLKTLYVNDNALTGRIPCDFWEKLDNEKLGIAWLSNNSFNSNCSTSMNKVRGKGDPSIATEGNNF